MPAFDYEALKGFGGKIVEIRTTEEETMRAKVTWVFPDERDLAYEVIETNQPERYRGDNPGGWSLIPWEYIEWIEAVSEEPTT